MMSSWPLDKTASSDAELVIRFSKPKSVGWLLFYTLLEGGTGYYFQAEQRGSTGWCFLLVIGALLLLASCRQLLRLANKEPQLTLSDQGIRRAAAPLDSWEVIQAEQVSSVPRSRGTENILTYEARGKRRKLRLGALAVSAPQLTQLLVYYCTRFQQRALGNQQAARL